MSVDVRFQLDNPDEMQATMRITMTVKEWKELKVELAQSYPSWKLSSAISDIVSAADEWWGRKIKP